MGGLLSQAAGVDKNSIASFWLGCNPFSQIWAEFSGLILPHPAFDGFGGVLVLVHAGQ